MAGVFIAWSGGLSKSVALALRTWIPDVLQTAHVFMSEKDIESGAKWQEDIAENLKKCNAGIICLTRENQSKPWINFEAGAISKTVEDRPCVMPYLIDFEDSDLSAPISEFQARKADEDGTRRIIETINSKLEPGPLPPERLTSSFDRCWPELQEKLDKARKAGPPVKTSPTKSDREFLEELQRLTRSISSQLTDLASSVSNLQQPRTVQEAIDRALQVISAQRASSVFGSAMTSSVLPSSPDKPDDIAPSGRVVS